MELAAVRSRGPGLVSRHPHLHELRQSGFLPRHVTASCPPGESKSKDTRYLDIHEDDQLDEAQLAGFRMKRRLFSSYSSSVPAVREPPSVSFECVQSVKGRPRESRDCAEIEPKLHQLLTGAQAVTGIAAEAPPEVQPPSAAYHSRGHGASEGRGAQ